jgi:hypothetical protein
VPRDWPLLVGAFDAYARRDSVVGASLLVIRDGLNP